MAVIDAKTPNKAYVEVELHVDTEGRIRPIQIIWDDERTFEIDRVTYVRQAASLKAGGLGMRYTCMVRGRERYLFNDAEGRWFLEKK